MSFAAQSGDTEHFKSALKTAALAEEMGNLAAHAAITRKSAYTALKPGSRPQMQTILGLLDARGMAIQIVPKNALEIVTALPACRYSVKRSTGRSRDYPLASGWSMVCRVCA